MASLKRFDGHLRFDYDGEDFAAAQALGFVGYGGSFEINGQQFAAMAKARLPVKSRPDFNQLMSHWGVFEPDLYDTFELLAITGAMLPTDTFELVPELMPVSGTCIYSRVAGHIFNEESERVKGAALGSRLDLRREPENVHDNEAVAVYLQDVRIGYVKKPLSRSVNNAIQSGLAVEGFLVAYNADSESGLNEISMKIEFR